MTELRQSTDRDRPTARRIRRTASALPIDDAAREWRVVVDAALSGAANMARDHALAAALRLGPGTVRVYRWRRATLSLGRNEPVTPAYRRFLRERPEAELVRYAIELRSLTGGRASFTSKRVGYEIVNGALPEAVTAQ